MFPSLRTVLSTIALLALGSVSYGSPRIRGVRGALSIESARHLNDNGLAEGFLPPALGLVAPHDEIGIAKFF